ncbi:bifunctional diaminohydroxyphosphoribosylaminopyrimidine deaminase/5-amino-6-(5-phosphoribosylamino)uracil reductase RibD [Rhodobacteraceae bacterium NNCM2]|nr:bifunctional diaminohydroxyphosphoribosylaminopyrimidine deaminase/5-amino-6-(5-phosphoribosylamino)uracil reductase RibD [Coraliihabitans acroporae]
MRRALCLAQEMRGFVWPNPPVGCVIVKDGVVVAEAATQPGGRPHAERKALDMAGNRANGATLYVTLEPCCHWGRTPPCTDAIINAGISLVVCAISDPDPRVNGGGFARLRDAGIDLHIGACADEAEELMSGFFHRIRHGIPEVVVVDGTPTAPPTGVDALIVSSPDGLRLLARRGELDLSGVEPRRLLARMGEIGLTTVAVSDHDPLIIPLLSTAGSEAKSANGTLHHRARATREVEDLDLFAERR